MYMYMVGMFVTDNGSGMSGEGAGHILPASGAMQPASKVKWAHGVGSRGRSKEARKNAFRRLCVTICDLFQVITCDFIESVLDVMIS